MASEGKYIHDATESGTIGKITLRELALLSRTRWITLAEICDWMDKTDVPKLLEWIHSIGRLEVFLDEDLNPHSAKELNTYSNHDNIRSIMTELGLNMSLKELDRYDELIANVEGKFPWLASEIPAAIRTLATRVTDEMSTVGLFFVLQDHARFWFEPTEGWENVIASLDDPLSKIKATNSTAEQQIVEASRCLAMARGTACVLHLNNVLELGLIRMRKKLPPKYLPRRKSEIDDLVAAINIYVQSTPTPSDAPAWRSISERCAAVRAAWRHPAVHADMIFSEESAYEAYIAIRGLMKEVILL